jgi:hypothetical protein
VAAWFILDFLGLYSSKDIVLKGTNSAKELELRRRHGKMMFDLKLQKMCRANEIRNLEKPILDRLDVLDEHNRTRRFFLKRLEQEIRNWSLPTIIIHLDV